MTTGNLTVRPSSDLRERFKQYADKHNISIAKAIVLLAEIGLQKENKKQDEISELRREIEEIKKRLK